MEGKGEETAVRLERKKKEIIEAKHLHLHPITQNAHHLHRNNTNMERFKRERDDKQMGGSNGVRRMFNIVQVKNKKMKQKERRGSCFERKRETCSIEVLC